MSALETVPRCWQKAVFATCFRCRTEVPMRRMASMYAWECPTCGGVYPCHPTIADFIELNPIPEPEGTNAAPTWMMDKATGIPYPDKKFIHDLQEPVTPVTHDIPPEKRATKGAVLAAEKLARGIFLLKHPERQGFLGESHDHWLIEWGTYLVELAELFQRFSEDVLKESQESHDLKT